MSGAGRIKFDGSTETELFEIKTTKAKVYRLERELLRALWESAVRQEKEPQLLIEFLSETTGEVQVLVRCSIMVAPGN